MKLIFEEVAARRQCAAEVLVGDLKMQCTFSTSKIVTIPYGWSYSGGRLEQSENAAAATLPVCQNHAARLKNDFAEILENNLR